MVLKDSSTASGSGGGAGVTWAYEVGGQTLVCPIIVEDLNSPGQMLIEVCKRPKVKIKIKIKLFSFNSADWLIF